ncbi:hypothetical protein ACIL82_13590, partial [Enterococcus faecium]
LIASGIGGGYSGYFDVVPYRMGGLGIFSLASYIPDSGEITMNVWHRLISYILTFIIAFIITLVYEQRRELKAEKIFAQWKMEQEQVEMVESLAHDLEKPLFPL